MRTALLLLTAALASPLGAQTTPWSPAALTAEDYARAERWLPANTNPLVLHGDVRPTWLPDGRFWYRNQIADGVEYVMVDVAARRRAPAFDHARMAAALSAAADTTIQALDLPSPTFAGAVVTFRLGERTVACDPAANQCSPADGSAPDRNAVVSPDGRRAAFVRGYDLWVRDLASGAERRLTSDGQEDFGYATNNAGWTKSDRPVVVWSPDSRRIATFQHDGRGVGEMVLTTTNVGHPGVETWKYPLPGDSVIFRIHRVIADAETGDVVRLRMGPDPHRSTICDHIVCGGEWADVQWSEDGAQLAFVSSSRDHRRATLRVASATTGEVRTVLEEEVPTFFESGYRTVNWRVLFASDEVIWYSQRDDWGHLYVYDLTTGALKRRLTEGAWNVLQVIRLDEDARTLHFIGAGREPGDPYFQYVYRVGLDGRGLQVLTPDSAHHVTSLSPDGRWLVDSRSTPDTPPVSTLRDARGREVMELERADISALLATGWKPPESITVKARDGSTDLYGLMFKPTNMDPGRRYPILNHIYPGPQSGSVGGRSFSAARGDAQALADLGFIVVEIDAMGTPMRSKSFHAAYYAEMGDNGLPDQVAGMRQLAADRPWIDLERAGIYGHSGGGFASTAGILRYPDFFKVAVSQAGNHDNRNYEDDWAEKWQGLLTTNADGTTSYDNQANQLLAGELKGKLLLAHGTMDNNVPPYSTLLVVDALIAANKNFDLIMMPNRRHGFGNETYMMRRRWDYFVENLLGATPPPEYQIGRRTVF